MCCAIQPCQLERFYSQESSMLLDEEDFPAIGNHNYQSIFRFDCSPKAKVDENHNDDVSPQTNKSKDRKSPPVVTEKKMEAKKKRKWKSVPLVETGFNMSLFPRPIRPEKIDPAEEERIFRQIEQEQNDYEETMDKYKNFDTKNCDPFEGICKGKDRFLRCDKDRKVRKAGKQVKDKYCLSLKNNAGRKKLYIHHRLYKLIYLEIRRISYLPSRTPNYVINNLITSKNRSTDSNRSKLKPNPPVSTKPAPLQNLHHALHRTNVPTDIASDLANVLINLQHRELTPEDYDLLLRLDERVAPKTISIDTLSTMKTDIVTEESAGDLCAVCMDPYEVGQNRKFLPCDHVFHAKCIDMWLENSSQNCPIDGLPIDSS